MMRSRATRTCSRRTVRILLVGDKSVGKTSIILSLVTEQFPKSVPDRMEELVIPADVTPELVPTHIVDYCDAEQTIDNLKEEISKANVICVVYSVIDDASLYNVGSYWLPLIRQVSINNVACPIVLVGNKIDLTTESTYNKACYIMDDFPEIESFVECSAKTLLNISETFYYAQNAVLHPIAPILSPETLQLTENAKKALTRIFQVSDNDNDGLLSDKEMNAFQRRCFDVPLRKDSLNDIKSVIRRNIVGGISPDDKITLQGFLFLHTLFMQRGRSVTTWSILRRFGYEENLELSKEYLYPRVIVPGGCSVELSHKGHAFLTSIFEKYDKDKDGVLSPTELENLFSICPAPVFKSCVSNMVPTNSKDWITLDGWICFWVYTTLFDYVTTLEYLAYLGYSINDRENQCSAITITREKKLDIEKKQSSRNVFVCHVIGEKGTGKTTLCQIHIGNYLHETGCGSAHGIHHHHGCVNTVHVYGQEKYLILRNIDIGNTTDPLMPTDVNCDIACLVYDASHSKSFEYVARVYLKYFSATNIPVLIVGNKVDLGIVHQEYFLQPDMFCAQHSLCAPVLFSCVKPKKELFVKLATMAAFPHVYNLGFIGSYDASSLWKAAGLSVTVVALLAIAITRFMRSDKSVM